MKGAIDKIVNSLSDHPEHTGLVVGVINQGEPLVFGYGQAGSRGASNGKLNPPDGDTLFEIGSVTKVFTASLLAVLVVEGRLKLDDPVGEHMPSLSHLPPEMTLLRLVTHTAGLPKMPSNVWRSAMKDRRNPNAAYTTEDLFQYLANYRSKQSDLAKSQISYSNLGYGLLGHILAQSCDSTYEEAVTSRICDGLAMADTRITLNPEQRERLAPPHTASGKPYVNWDLPAFAGAGALRSTAGDLLRFLGANLGNPRSPMTDALQACHQIRSETFRQPGLLQTGVLKLLRRGQETGHYRHGMALGWHVGTISRGGSRLYWHHGATGGYRAFAGFTKNSQVGVVVLANRGPGKLDLISLKTPEDAIGISLMAYLDSFAH